MSSMQVLRTCLTHTNKLSDDCQKFHTGFWKVNSLPKSDYETYNYRLLELVRQLYFPIKTNTGPRFHLAILYRNNTQDVRLNEMEVKFTLADWCHPVS
jgi:hypothetical protein